MKKSKKFFILSLFVLMALLDAVQAEAASLSQTSVTLSVGQTNTVNAYNVYNSLYVSNNSNSNVASVTINGNNINIYGSTSGNTTATICEYSTSSCNSLYITVNGGYYNNTNNTGLNISNFTLPIGSSATLSSSNGTSLNVSSNSNPNVASATYSSLAPGCYGNSTYSITTGQPCYANNYYVNNNGSLLINALSAGSSTITVCQNQNQNYNYNYNNNGNCNTVYVTVTGGITPVPYTNYQNYYPGTPTVLGASTCYFARSLWIGTSGADVSCLQTLLADRGYFSNQNNFSSYFDSATKNAVMAFQRDNYLFSDGIVGRNTRALLFGN